MRTVAFQVAAALVLVSGCRVNPQPEHAKAGGQLIETVSKEPTPPAEPRDREGRLERVRAIARQCQELDEQRAGLLLEAGEGKLALGRRLAEAGGWRPYFTRRIKELEELGEPREKPPVWAGPDRSPSALKGFLANMPYIDCSGPFVYGLIGEQYVEPGMLLVVVGCSFGSREGQLRLLTNDQGGHFLCSNVIWQDDLIVASMPAYEQMRSLVDHDWQLQVVQFGSPPGSGARSKPYPVRFQATRATQPVFGAFMSAKTSYNHSDGRSQVGVPWMVCDFVDASASDKVYRVIWSATGFHQLAQRADTPRFGTDTWRIRLINGWMPVTAVMPNLFRAQLVGAGTDIRGPFPDTLSDPDIEIRVDWEVHAGDGILGTAEYALMILIEGPKDVPYAAGISPSWGFSYDVALPGQVCTGP